MEHLLPQSWLEAVPLPWLKTLIVAGFAVLLALLIRWVALSVLRRIANSFVLPQQLIYRAASPTLCLLPLIALQTVWTSADNDLPLIGAVQHVNGCSSRPDLPG